jgi:hypothetical protein
MATHGPCETEGPGLLFTSWDHSLPARTKANSAGPQAPQRRPGTTDTRHVRPALRGRPATMAAPDGRELNASLHIV